MVEKLPEQGHPSVVRRRQPLVGCHVGDTNVIAVHLDAMLGEQHAEVRLRHHNLGLGRSEGSRLRARCIQICDLHVGHRHRVKRAGQCRLGLAEQVAGGERLAFGQQRRSYGRVDRSDRRFDAGDRCLRRLQCSGCIGFGQRGAIQRVVGGGHIRLPLRHRSACIGCRLLQRGKFRIRRGQCGGGILRREACRVEVGLRDIGCLYSGKISSVILLRRLQIHPCLFQRLSGLDQIILCVVVGGPRLVSSLQRSRSLRVQIVEHGLRSRACGVGVRHFLIGCEVGLFTIFHQTFCGAQVRACLRPLRRLCEELGAGLEA